MQSIADLLDSLPKRAVKLPQDYYDKRVTAAKDLAFTVSGIQQLDVIQAILDSLNDNIKAGGSFAAWKRKIEADEIPLELPAHRKELIFRNHAGTAYMHGKCKNAKQNAIARPYAMYNAIGDNRTRPSHLKWHKTVLPINHAWWKTHTPKNGHNCRCDIILLTEKQAKNMGITAEADIEWGAPDEGWNYSPCDHFAGGEIRSLERKEPGYHPKLRGFVSLLLAGLNAVKKLLGD